MMLRLVVIFSLLYCTRFTADCQTVDGLATTEEETFEADIHDSLSYTTVRNVNVTGYKRTRLYIVEREVTVHPGDLFTKAKLNRALRQTREQLMNTALFVDVVVNQTQVENAQVDISIEVKERWYVFPVPYFKVVDRNWNVWIKEHNASLDRANIGLKVTHSNATGINDKLNIWVIGGYTQQLSFNYFRPYFDKRLRFGYNLGFAYARNREVNYATEYNKLLTTDTSIFNRKYLHAEGGLSYRKGSKLRMQLKLGFTKENFDSSIAKLNPDFLGGGRTSASYVDLTYGMQYFNVDYIPYPLRGWYVDVYALNRMATKGDLSMLQLGGKFLGTWEVMNKAWLAFQAAAIIRLPSSQPYYNSRLLGFGDVAMQGLEYYVADGAVGGMVRATIRRQVYQFTIKKLFKSKSHNNIPFRFFLKAYGNLGYVYNRNPGTSFMNNKLLRTAGVGLDIVTIYDWAIKLDFSFNQFDSGGKLYFHTQSDF
ncbi:MAG: POTRA domain-containing protein [Bacteroidota bacterium]